MPKFALVTTQVEEFETRAELDHYVKEHSPLDFDQKVELLEKSKIVVEGDDINTTIEILNEFNPGENTEEPKE